MLKSFLTYAEDDGQPQGGGADDQPSDGGRVRASELRQQLGQSVDEQSLMRLLEKQADLLTDNHKLRERVRKMRELPANAVVLSGDDASAWEAYRVLGKPDELKQHLTAKSTVEQELITLKRDATLRDVRDATGYDLDVLRDIGGAEWQYTIKEEQVGDAKQKVVYVKDGDKEQRIDEHPKVQRFLPALKPQVAQGSQAAQASGGTSFVPQNVGGKPPAQNAGKTYTQSQKYAVPGKAS